MVSSWDPSLNHTCKDPIQISSHAQGPGVKTWTYLLQGHYLIRSRGSCWMSPSLPQPWYLDQWPSAWLFTLHFFRPPSPRYLLLRPSWPHTPLPPWSWILVPSSSQVQMKRVPDDTRPVITEWMALKMKLTKRKSKIKFHRQKCPTLRT